MADVSKEALTELMLEFMEMERTRVPLDSKNLSLEEQFRSIIQSLLVKHPDWRDYLTTEEDYKTVIGNCVAAYKKEGGVEYA